MQEQRSSNKKFKQCFEFGIRSQYGAQEGENSANALVLQVTLIAMKH